MTTTELRNKLEDIMVNFVVLINPEDIFMVSDKKRMELIRETGEYFTTIIEAIDNDNITVVDSDN